jgi:hypothetical protein
MVLSQYYSGSYCCSFIHTKILVLEQSLMEIVVGSH